MKRIKRFVLEKTNLKPYHFFYLAFFLGYSAFLYYTLYHVSGLQPFQVNVHFFSNTIGSLSKRLLSEVGPYALIFFLLYYTKTFWIRIVLIALFLALFLINVLTIAFHFITRSNFQFYIFEGFNLNILLSFFTPRIWLAVFLLIAVMTGTVYGLLKFKNREKKLWIAKKRFFLILLTLLAFGSPLLPVRYSDHASLRKHDSLIKRFFKTINLEQPGTSLLYRELKYLYLPPQVVHQELTADEEAQVSALKLDEQLTQLFPNPPKKIVLVVAESLNQSFLSQYNDQIPGATPNLDRLILQHSSIGGFYPSGPYTLQGLSTMLCGHTNSRQTQLNPDHVCTPKQLLEAGFDTEFIRGASKYYVGENIHFNKFGFDSITAKEELTEKFPDFKEAHSGEYKSWGYTDNFVFDEAVDRLKNSQSEDKLFLTLLTVDTHIPGGRCAYERTENDPENPLLFSINCFDRVFGEFMDTLEKEGLFDEDLMVLLTSDQLYPAFKTVPGDEFATSFVLQPGRIPFLMISKSDFELKADWGSHVDIAATLLDAVNLEVPSYYMGKSLLSNETIIPMGQDRQDGYMIVGNQFHPLSLNPQLERYQKKEVPKGFSIKLSPQDDLQAIAQQKIDEIETQQNQESAFFKWYYNKFFNLANGD